MDCKYVVKVRDISGFERGVDSCYYARQSLVRLFCHKCKFSHGLAVLVGLGLISEVLLSHSDTPHSVELLRTRDRPVPETSDNTQHSQQTSMLRRDSYPQSQQANSRRPTSLPARPLGSANDVAAS
jgi:hypothetical protein